MFSSLTGPRHVDNFDWFEEYFPGVEVLNGHMLPFHNRKAQVLAEGMGKAGVGGSDAHTMGSLGIAYTEVPNARNIEEFLRGLRAGHAIVRGRHGGYLTLTHGILCIAGGMIKERPWTAVLAPLVAVLPVATLLAILDEMHFARRWSRYRAQTCRVACEAGNFLPSPRLRRIGHDFRQVDSGLSRTQ